MDSPNLTGTPEALADLTDPRLDDRLRRLLELLLVDHLLNVRLVATGHQFGPFTPNGQPNDHYYFCAVDIDAVGGLPVAQRPIPAPVVALGRTLSALPQDVRPPSVLGPAEWHAALGGGKLTGFRDEPAVNARHHDHLHLGFRPVIGETAAGQSRRDVPQKLTNRTW